MPRSPAPTLELWLVRHGETEWSKAMRHTGRSDIPLTGAGRSRARALAPLLGSHDFDQVLCSPLTRARETARLAGFGDRIRLDDDIAEWDYGGFEGRTAKDLARELGGFNIWTTPVTGGETLDQVADRADRVLERLAAATCCSPTATCCASSPPAGWDCLPRAAGFSPWMWAASPCSAWSTTTGSCAAGTWLRALPRDPVRFSTAALIRLW